MNIDTVETQTSSKVTESATAEEIAANYKCEEWGYADSSSLWSQFHGSAITGTGKGAVSDFQSGINEWFSISDATINGKTRPTIQMKKHYADPYKVFIDSSNYVTVTQGTKFSAIYETNFGATDLTGTTDICGEAVFWFKLDQANENGYGVLFDNHTGCGFFNNHDYTVYLVKMKSGIVSAYDYNQYKGAFAGFAKYPEYNIVVSEEDGLASVEITPANSTAGLIDGGTGGCTNNSNKIKWENFDVAMYEVPFTQAYGFYRFGGIYFAGSKTTMERTIVKSFGDIVYEPEWTDGALHMLINMDTKADSTMLGTDGGL